MKKIREQLVLPNLYQPTSALSDQTYLERLTGLLASNLDFHQQDTQYATHAIHAFPAKFPPQLPRVFIEQLTQPGDIVLDPMAGSGTTLVEACLSHRIPLGLDIDPLALRVSHTKVTTLDSEKVLQVLDEILQSVENRLQEDPRLFAKAFNARFDKESQRFIQYWFPRDTIRVLFYLSEEIRSIEHESLRDFFEVAFSSIIITKNGGVSLALDLAHTRPHKAKIVYDENGQLLYAQNTANISPKRQDFLTKRLRPVLPEFEHQVRLNLKRLQSLGTYPYRAAVVAGNARFMPLSSNSIDLIITSPPYASNAIDYMRAHKFSLVWFGYPVKDLGKHRKKYIGGESLINSYDQNLPENVNRILENLHRIDQKKAQSVHRYYTEMKDVLSEMYRVLKPGKAAILVVGTSVLRGVDIEIGNCLAEIGKLLGFEVPHIGLRNLDRNRRMLPTGKKVDTGSQIQQRMHQEFVIGFYKPMKD